MINLKNIIFDLGGVVYDIRYENVAEAFVRHGVDNLGDFYSKKFQTREMDLFEIGLMSAADYRDYLRRMSGKALTDSELDEIVNAILIDVPRERVELLRRLRSRYGVYLFSNTNEINYNCFTKHLRNKYGFDVFAECFDAAYFSHQMHLRKPAREGFERIIAEQHLNPADTLFIDDIEGNLRGAREAGLHGYHLASGSIVDLFDHQLNFLGTLND